MLNIFIVDDEKPIRQWFEHVIKQYAGEFNIAGLAANGQEAWTLCQSAVPDLIITDIKMPVMSGLELIERVMELNAGTSFLILSNYDEFDFVRKGLRIGVKDYLLKAETDDQDIIAALRKIAGEHEQRPRPAAKEDIVKQNEGPWVLRDVLNQPAEWLPPAMAQERMRWIYCGFDAAAGADSLNLAPPVWFEECGRWAAMAFGQAQLYTDERDNIAILVRSLSAQSPRTEDDWAATCRSWSEEIHSRYSCTVSFGISAPFETFLGLKNAFWEAKLAYRQKFYTGARSVNLADSSTDWNAGDAALTERLRPLKSAELLDSDLLERVRHKLDELRRYRIDPVVAMDAFRSLLERLESQLPEKAGIAVGEVAGPSFDTDMLPFWEELQEAVMSRLRFMQELAHRHTFVYSMPTNRVIAYIREHFAEKISMTILAEQVHLNENYLSQVFKKDTGMTVTRFLIEVRMEQAKKLLTTRRYKVNEVAAEVGYGSEAHFSTAYKSHYGMTPSQYVESLRFSK